MTREEVIALARKAGFVIDEEAYARQPNCIFHTWHMIDEGLTRFASLVATAENAVCLNQVEILVEAERDACLKIIERYQATKDSHPIGDLSGAWMVTAFEEIKATIRARGINE